MNKYDIEDAIAKLEKQVETLASKVRALEEVAQGKKSTSKSENGLWDFRSRFK